MKILYNFEQFSRLKCFWNDDNNRYLPFKIDFFMFNNLCNMSVDNLTFSELYDKTILERELYSRMCSMCLFDYLRKEVYYNERR